MPRRGENIYKRKDGRWEARYIHHYENGKAKYRFVYGGSYSEIKSKLLTELTVQNNTLTFSDKKSADFNDISSLWLSNRKNKIKESTYTRYARIIEKYIIPNLDTTDSIMIDNTVINNMFGKLKSSLSDKSVLDIQCVFNSIWKFGKENGYPCCELNIDRIKIKKAKKISVILPFDREKIELALINKNDLFGMGVLFAMFTGVRIGELCGLQWGDIDFTNGYAVIHRTIERIADLDNSDRKTKIVVSTPKTDNSSRIIPLPTFLVEYLKRFRQSDEKYILTSSVKYTEPHTFYIKYKKFLIKNNLGNYTFHELRHTFATQCVDMGFDIKSLSEILGHSNVSTTMNLYVHPTFQMQKRQMDMLVPSCHIPSK